MHFFSTDQKIWHFFVKISQYFKDRICGGAAVGCGKATFHVRKRTFHAPMVRFTRRSRVILLYCRPRAGGVVKRQLMSILFFNYCQFKGLSSVGWKNANTHWQPT